MKKITFIIFLYDKKLEEIVGNSLGSSNEIEAKLTIKINEIKGIREIQEDESDEIHKSRCLIYTTYDDSFIINLSYDAALKLLEANGW